MQQVIDKLIVISSGTKITEMWIEFVDFSHTITFMNESKMEEYKIEMVNFILLNYIENIILYYECI